MGIFLSKKSEEVVTHTSIIFKEFNKIRHSIPKSDFDMICDGDIFSDQMEDSLKRVFTMKIDAKLYYNCLHERGEIVTYSSVKTFLERDNVYNVALRYKYIDVRGALRRLFMFFIGRY